MSALQSPQTDVLRRLHVLCLACGFALACGTVARTDEPARTTVDWQARSAAGLVTFGEVLDLTEQRPHTHTHALKVVSPAQPGQKSPNPTIQLATIENPPISRQSFALNGWIRHSGVEGAGYLEMWAVFPDGSHYFSRTLGTIGPMKSLRGDSDWREISLPFQLSDDPTAPKPNKLIVNAVLPGAGEFVLSDLVLLEADNVTAAMTPGAWWSDRSAGLVGGIGGSLIGVCGAIVGVLAGMGIGRRLVVTLLIAGSILGAVLLTTGVVALSIGQPYAVYYPLLLSGGLCAVMGAVGAMTVRQRYAAVELRRMEALDA